MMDDANRLYREAFQHGRTQERLREAVDSLRRIKDLCIDDPKRRAGLRSRLLEIEADVCATLNRLSASTGGVIDDMEPTA